MTEQQLKELILEVREKIQEYDRKLQDLEKEKERMQTAQQTLKKDIDTLNNLRVDLAASVASLKSERDALLKARTEIEQVEKTNLMAIASAYDKMDAARAGEILKSMAQGQTAQRDGRQERQRGRRRQDPALHAGEDQGQGPGRDGRHGARPGGGPVPEAQAGSGEEVNELVDSAQPTT